MPETEVTRGGQERTKLACSSPWALSSSAPESWRDPTGGHSGGGITRVAQAVGGYGVQIKQLDLLVQQMLCTKLRPCSSHRWEEGKRVQQACALLYGCPCKSPLGCYRLELQQR